MKPENKYNSLGLPETECEPGSRGRVLRNKLGIKTKKEMDLIEAYSLSSIQLKLPGIFGSAHRLTSDDICLLHRLWLGNIYDWAGKYRNVNASKGGFMFASARQIPRLMAAFEKDILGSYTPCDFRTRDRTIEAISIVHVELVLIHPFREGNGRVARLLSGLMAYQSGLPDLDFTFIKGNLKNRYFGAVQSGVIKDYEPMKNIFSYVIEKSVEKADKILR